ncbi:Activator of basal transcription 1 [Lobulomyces angularis]|nr:Activator of basal transcription 1 [Lobulomyces angularis]
MKNILITGASSGIGKSLALEYASRASSINQITLLLTARRLNYLVQLKEEIEKKFSETVRVEVEVLDVTNYEQVFKVFDYFVNKVGVIHTVIVNAGIGQPLNLIGSKSVFKEQKAIIETNLLGAMACINVAIEHFRKSFDKGGKLKKFIDFCNLSLKGSDFRLVGISSIVEAIGLPTAASYSASKVALTNYLNALQVETYYEDITVTIISPGFIDTPMSQDPSVIDERVFLISDTDGAKRMYDVINKKTMKAFIPYFPWTVLAFLLKFVPIFDIRLDIESDFEEESELQISENTSPKIEEDEYSEVDEEVLSDSNSHNSEENSIREDFDGNFDFSDVVTQKKPITVDQLKKFNSKINKSGVVYLSKIPPFMKPIKLKQLLSKFGEIGRVFLEPEDSKITKRRIKYKGNKRQNFVEGWVEFADKKVARQVAEMLNGQIIGGKKRNFYHDDIWNIKYLPRFKWDHLTEQVAYEHAVKDQKVRQETSQAKKETKLYMSNVAKGKMIESIEAKKKKKREKFNTDNGNNQSEKRKADDVIDLKLKINEEVSNKLEKEKFKRSFKQRRVFNSDNDQTKIVSEKRSKVLSKIFN